MEDITNLGGAALFAGGIQIKWFLTTTLFSREARNLAQKNTISIVDGEQMSQWIVRKGLGFVKKENGPKFSIQDFAEWIRSWFKQYLRFAYA